VAGDVAHDHDHDVESEGEPRVSPLELFFDLVFVFALTQVTFLLAEDLTPAGLLRGLAVLAIVWWSWVGFSWLTNYVASDDGWTRLVLFAAMGAMLVMSLAVPTAFGSDGLTFGAGYLALSLLFIATYAVTTRNDPEVFGAVLRLSPGVLIPAVLVLGAGFLDAGPGRGALWALALVVAMVGPFVSGTEGWRVHAGHFSERHALIIIIALGESIVSIGVGLSGEALGVAQLSGAMLGLIACCCLWWLYFDVVALVAERRLEAAEGSARNAMARDSYSYLHFPMVAGIVLFALGVKKVLIDVDGPLKQVALAALLGGVALYLLGHVGFRLRNTGTLNTQRLVLAVALLLAWPLLGGVDGLAVLIGVTVALVLLVGYETVKYREARHAVRAHGAGGSWGGDAR
jgi:low temperature requirement protein LtrA